MNHGTATVLFAPDSFKGSAGAADVARALAEGWRLHRPGDQTVLRPVADGGEGTLDAFAAAVPGSQRMPVVVTGPDGIETDATWLLLPATPEAPAGTGVVELASTSGIELLGERRLPWDADTRGFGQAIVAALDHGVSALVLGIGSSASTDGGVGLLRALGAHFLDEHAREVEPGARGLARVASVDTRSLRALPPAGALVLSDVTSPLCGPSGAAAVFGPQKGLLPDEVASVDGALAQVAALLPGDPRSPGAGAAGGAGFGLQAWGAQIVPGAGEICEILALTHDIAAADIVVTGEGAFDGQSGAGKAPAHVAALAGAADVPVALVAGYIAGDADTTAFVARAELISIAGSAESSLAEPLRWLHAAGAALAESFSHTSSHL